MTIFPNPDGRERRGLLGCMYCFELAGDLRYNGYSLSADGFCLTTRSVNRPSAHAHGYRGRSGQL